MVITMSRTKYILLLAFCLVCVIDIAIFFLIIAKYGDCFFPDD